MSDNICLVTADEASSIVSQAERSGIDINCGELSIDDIKAMLTQTQDLDHEPAVEAELEF